MNTLKNRYFSPFVTALAFAFALTLGSCESPADLNGVDLRFEEVGKLTVEDLYFRTAADKTPVKLRVRSDQDWKVYGNSDWYTITPSEGEANFDLKDENGNPVGTEVTIVCNENVELDTREDIISIESGDWVGKTFTLRQQGIAYLKADVTEFTRSKDNGSASFNVITNQPYTVEITEGADWISIVENAKGGSPKVEETINVKVEYNANLGEERTGVITLFDRNHDEATKVNVLLSQEGLTLIPSIPGNGYYKIEDHKESIVEIPVESNSPWTVEKENATDDWYEFVDGTSFEGNATLRVKLAQNDGSAVRAVNLKLKTDIEGADNVLKTVTIKQANLPKTQVYPINAGGVGTWNGASEISFGSDRTKFNPGQEISLDGFNPGVFKLTVSGMSATSAPYLFLEYLSAEEGTQHEIRIKFNDVGRPYWTFLTPWAYAAPQVNNWCVNNIGAIDTSVENVMEIRISRYTSPRPDAAKEPDALWIEWYFNGVHCHTATTDGLNCPSGASPSGIVANGAYVQPYLADMKVKLGCAAAACYLNKFEYTPNVDWGD